jgi:hypothetical protein
MHQNGYKDSHQHALIVNETAGIVPGGMCPYTIHLIIPVFASGCTKQTATKMPSKLAKKQMITLT